MNNSKKHFISIPLKKRNEIIDELKKRYDSLNNVLLGKMNNDSSEITPICYDGVHSCPTNELYEIDVDELKEKIIRLEYEIRVIKEILL